MIVFRLICAFLLAWAVNWALSRPEAIGLVEELPEMEFYSLIAALAAGYFNLAVRQGWGMIVAFANGIWAGVLSIFMAGAFFMCVELMQGLRSGVVKDFDKFLTLFGEAVEPLLDQLINIQLLIVSLGATAVVGVVTEILHWLLVRFRQGKPKPRANI